MEKVNFLYKALGKIIQIREYETAIAEDFSKNKIWSFLHLTVGQEATAVGGSNGFKEK